MAVDGAGSTGTAAKPAPSRARRILARLRGPTGIYIGGIVIALAVAALQISGAIDIGSAVAFTCAIMLAAFFLARAMRRQEKLLSDVRISESRFRDYTESISDWYWETDPDHRVAFMSERPTIHGIQTKPRIGMTRWEIATDVEDEPEKWRRHREVLERRQSFRDFVYRSEPSEKQIVHNSVSGKPFFGESGRFLGYRGTARDVTAQVLAEQAAQKALSLLADAIESLPDSFALFDAEDRFVMCNSAFRRFVTPSIELKPGLAFFDLISKVVGNFVFPNELGATPEAWLQERMRRHRNPGQLMEWPLKDGRWLRAVEARTGDGGTVVLNIDVTLQKQTEQEAQNARNRLTDAIDSLPDAFAIFDRDDRLIHANDEYVRHLAVKPVPGASTFADMLPYVAAQIALPDALGATPEEWMAERMRRHRAPGAPFELRYRNGMWGRVVETRTRDGGSVMLRTDITAQKHAERKAVEAHQRLVDAIDSLPYAFGLYDKDDRLIAFNRSLRGPADSPLTLDATTFRDVVSEAAPRVVLPDALGDTPEKWAAERMRRHRDSNYSIDVHYKDGRWGHVIESRTREGGTTLQRIDITELKKRQETAERLAQQQKAVAVLSQLALKTADPIQLCQQAVELIAKALSVELASALELDADGANVILRAAVGWKPGSIGAAIPVGARSLAGLTLMADKPLVVEDLARETRFVPSPMLLDHKVKSAITVVISGHPRPFGTLGAYSTQPRLFDHGHIEFMQSAAFVLSSIIERRKSEQMFAQTQRLEALGKLTGGIAHDFNNLLTVIIGQADLLAGDLKEAPMQSEMARTVVMAAKRAAELTDQLLSFARGQTLQLAVTDVNRLIGDTEALLRRTLGEHIDIRIALGKDLPHCRTDRTQFVNALINLAVNSRDAMPEGGRLTIETSRIALDAAYAAAHSEVAPGDYLMIAVSDTGHGMTPDVLARVFEPFFTTKAMGRGTGLGLSMVYGFVKQSGGHVTAYSEAGHGTTIKLYLPVAAGLAAGETAAVAATAALEPADEAAAGRTILMVEDNDLVRAFTAAQLQRLGYGVVQARDGPEALEHLRGEAKIDLLFSDIVMPGGMNGPQVAESARKLRPGLPVLLTSGYPAAALSNLPLGGQEFETLSKPYRLADLAQRIRAVLDRK